MKLVEQAATNTLPKLLARNAAEHPQQPGMREKDRGIWKTYSWHDCQAHVRAFALGLAANGFGRGGKLSVLGDNRAPLYWAQLAAQAMGGLAVPLYQDSIASELVYVLDHAEVSVVVAEDQEQVDKVLSVREQLPKLRLIIFENPLGMSSYRDHPMLRSFPELEEQGRAFSDANRGYYEAELAKGTADDIALVAYTSGTTGRSKGALLSHGNLIAVVESFMSIEPVKPGDNWLSYLPMAWVGDSIFSLGTSLVAASTSNCPEGPETVQRDLRELGPSALLGPPRIWENMLTALEVRAADASPLKRKAYAYFRDIAVRRELLKEDKKPIPFGTRLAYRIGEFVVYGPVRDQLGLRHTRWCLTGGAPLGADTFRLFRSFGVNLKQVYGATEAALVALQHDGEADPNTVGRNLPGTEVRIGDLGEVQVRGPAVFKGYYKQDDATRDTLTTDGWLRTGDAGFIDPHGQLVIIDRAKDVGKLLDGTPFAPAFIENKLKFSPFIREVVAFGDQHQFVAAMVAIDINTVGKWAEQRGMPYTSYIDLSSKPDVAELILGEVRKINGTLPDALKVRRIVLLNKELDADDAEITRTRKVRRGFIVEKYAPVIGAFYDGGTQAQLTMDITFEDGRKNKLTSTLLVHDVDRFAGARQEAA